MNLSTLIRAMSAAGATPEAIALAVEHIEQKDAEIEARRANDRDRKRRQRERDNPVTNPESHVTVTGQSQESHSEQSPYKDNSRAHAVVSNGSSLRSEPVSLEEKLKPTVLAKSPKKSDDAENLKILSECLSPEMAADVLAYRKAAKGATTPGAMRGLAKQFRDTGNPQTAALEYMAGGYRGFFPKGQQSRDGPEKPKNPWTKRLIDGEREYRAKVNGNDHGLGLHDLEILRGGQEPTMLDLVAVDVGDDAAPRGK